MQPYFEPPRTRRRMRFQSANSDALRNAYADDLEHGRTIAPVESVDAAATHQEPPEFSGNHRWSDVLVDGLSQALREEIA